MATLRSLKQQKYTTLISSPTTYHSQPVQGPHHNLQIYLHFLKNLS